ncbi:MupG family TIM beta-alpha barrel fold protein [Psychrobacillus sp. FJAT-51614]|uniref:MupG family TIM beta-alpha barrel fold protein n=1 Tax=Psychrobacillus mangrovi TaxID=3117745 RepID=A0ABU8FD62_9BACI
MQRLGISIYPEHSTKEKDIEYLTLAAKYGFKRVFTCLLSVEGKNANEIKKEYKEIIGHANSLEMEVILDVAPNIFSKLGITYEDLSFFAELGAAGIRLDEGFDGAKEAFMTYNPYNLKIEMNASMGTKHIDNILSYRANKENIITSHNFYPQMYTGISFKHFEKCSIDLKNHGLRVAAFISSQNDSTFGPWPVNEGLCTLEEHRFLPMDVAARHLFATGLVDDVIVANAYASEEELKALSNVNPAKLTFKIEINDQVSDVEKEIIFNFPHYVRGDMSEYMARSTMSRITYKDADIQPHHTDALKRGNIIIINNAYGRYKGELHIVLKDMPNNGCKNIVGCIPENELKLLEYIEPWRVFQIIL